MNTADNLHQPETHAVRPETQTASVISSSPISQEAVSKVWVARLKNIMHLHPDDPYAVQNEVSKLRVEYIKTQYGQDIKFISSD